jgi:hypothetical protein
MVGVGPAAADIDCAGVALVPLRQPALAAVVYPRIGAYVSLVFCRRKLMAWLVWGPLLLMLMVLVLPWFLSGSLLWLLWYALELEPMYPWYSVGVS